MVKQKERAKKLYSRTQDRAENCQLSYYRAPAKEIKHNRETHKREIT